MCVYVCVHVLRTKNILKNASLFFLNNAQNHVADTPSLNSRIVRARVNAPCNYIAWWILNLTIE